MFRCSILAWLAPRVLNNMIEVMPETIETAKIKRLRWEKPEWPAAFLSLALTQLEARWESLVSDIGMAGVAHLLALPKQIRIKRSWMDDKKVLLTLTDFICLAFLHCALSNVSSKRWESHVSDIGMAGPSKQIRPKRRSWIDDTKVLLTLGTGRDAGVGNHSDFLSRMKCGRKREMSYFFYNFGIL